MLVVVGVAVAASGGLPTSGAQATALLQTPATAFAIFALSLVPSSISSILKERTFKRAQKTLGQRLDIFVVNSFTSGFQALFVLLQLPLIASLQGIPLTQIPGV